MTPDAPKKRLDLLRASGEMKWIAGAVLIVFVALIGIAVYFTSNPAFFGRYRGLTRNVETLQSSTHSGLECDECHAGSRGPAVRHVALVGDFYRSLVGKQQREPSFTKFAKPTNEACLTCHENDWSYDSKRTSKVPHPAHLRVNTETRECVMCHKWTAHEESYMQKHKAMPFSGVCATYECHVGWKQADECSTCHHTLRADPTEWKRVHPQAVQTIGANACLETCHEAQQCRTCHTTGKTPVFTGLNSQTGLKAIEVLHVKPDWIQQHGTEALKDQSKCLICHVSEGECQDCHARRPAFHGSTSTWLGAHKNFAKNPRRCLTCHKEPWCKDCHDQFKEMR